tara:strand:- start:337 stop:1443 length:1107 start_codon:yes stop_codon:yes gene_type:complete
LNFFGTGKKTLSAKKKIQKRNKKNDHFQEFKKLLSESKRILISTHALPDGDGLGAEYALFHYLKKIKKSCRVYNPDPCPPRYQFMDPKKAVLLGPREVQLWDSWDLWVILDTNDPRRLKNLWGELSLRSKKIVFLDHHPILSSLEESVHYPPHALIVSETESSSIGELLYRAFSDLNLTSINKEIALGLYVSVMTDTNSFRYSRTTPLSHRIAGEMIEHGVNAEEVYQQIYSSKEVNHLRLLGHMLSNVKVSKGGKLAWIEVNLETRKQHRATADDTQSFLNLLLLLKDAEVVCLFREEENQQIRVSLKSKGKVIINRIAEELGGGGHDYAAGFAVSATLKKTVQSVTTRLLETIEYFEKFGKLPPRG